MKFPHLFLIEIVRPHENKQIINLICGSNGCCYYAFERTGMGRNERAYYYNRQVGIGLNAPVAWLHIYENMPEPAPWWMTQIPKLKIDSKVDIYNPNLLGVLGPNIMEVMDKNSGAFVQVINQFGNTALGSQPQENDRLTVSNNISLSAYNTPEDDATEHLIRAWGSRGILGICQNKSYLHGPSMKMLGKEFTADGEKDPGEICLISYGTEGRGIAFQNWDPGNGVLNERLRMMNNGQIIIGDKAANGNYADFRLSVDGNIVCKKAVVQIANWADYVFEPGYTLPTLQEVETFVKTNKHLPDVPSQACVSENGVDVGDMNRILLQKVEELTLYLIEMKKEQVALQLEINNLKK